MKKVLKFLPFIAVVLVYILFRAVNIFDSSGINDIELKTLGIVHSSFPFGIIKQSLCADNFFPFYYWLIFLIEIIFKNEIILRVLNALMSAGTVWFAFDIGRKIKGIHLGLFIALLFSINHFFFYYSNLIAPYCLLFFIGMIVINFLYDFLKTPDKSNLRKLLIINLLFILVDKTAIAYVLSEIIVLAFIKIPDKSIKKAIPAFCTMFFLGLFLTFPFWFVQFFARLRILIPDLEGRITFNFNGLYLTLNEYITPYLSFCSGENSSKSTLGILYSFFLNPDITNINSLKLFLTLLYSSILPLGFGVFLCAKAYFKNFRLSVIARIALLNFALFMIFAIFRLCDLKPIYISQFFICFLILFGYGITLLKDKFLKYLFIVCFILIQVINPKINSFNIVIDKKYSTVNVFNTFLAEYKTANEAIYIVPYKGHFVKPYFNRRLTVSDFDSEYLLRKDKEGFMYDLGARFDKKPSKKTAHTLIQGYLAQNTISPYIVNYIDKNILQQGPKTVILFVDKMNSRPISFSSVERCSKIAEFKNSLPKMSFKNPQNSYNSKNKLILNSLKSKTLYDTVAYLEQNFYMHSMVQYKKTGNVYQKIPNASTDIFRELSSYSSDYMFIIFGKMPD